MFFRRIILTSLLVGLVGGLFMTLGQQWQVAPIIIAAEVFEVAEPEALVTESSAHNHGDDQHHDAQAWAPEDGAERFIYSGLSNVLAAVGFSALLLAIMCQLQLSGITRLTPLKGLAWGLAGFVAFFVAPGLGLPPEIPGVEAAPLENRQAWWVLTVLATGVGLGVLAFAPKLAKIGGALLLAVPHIIVAPRIAGPEFSHPDPQVVQTLMSLHVDFIVASAFTNGVFWVILGLASAWMLNRWVLKDAERSA
jgi:cobalt transporter subunit CbtA